MISRGLPKMSGGQTKYDQTWVNEDEQFGCDNILHHTLLYIRYRFGKGENLFVQNIHIHVKRTPKTILSHNKLRLSDD
jgi:hypothetical protein